MQIGVKKNRQFPDGVIDLRGLSGKETIIMDARLRQELWINGKSEGPNPIFGGLDVRVSQGPRGFGLEIGRRIADVPITVKDETGTHQTDLVVFVGELVPEPTGPKEWRPPR